MKFSCVYVEEEVRGSPRVEEILSRLSETSIVTVDRYGEVFNRKSQNFRLQKRNPALILARKHGKLVLPAPTGYGFNDAPGFYFSHMLNCVYDCRYCFLQGMYRSANYVLFCNYEDFAQALADTGATHNNAVFYSGYDCDSLALEPVSKFVNFFIRWIARHPQMTMEIRTKSTQVRDLLEFDPLANCVIAMSFTPSEISQRWESRVPGISKRLDALARLQQHGWPVALRFEPLIYMKDFLKGYEQLFAELFSKLDADSIHSISTGMFRMPKNFYRNIVDLYPDEELLARQTEEKNGVVSQPLDQELQLRSEVEKLLFRYIDKTQYYHCA